MLRAGRLNQQCKTLSAADAEATTKVANRVNKRFTNPRLLSACPFARKIFRLATFGSIGVQTIHLTVTEFVEYGVFNRKADDLFEVSVTLLSDTYLRPVVLPVPLNPFKFAGPGLTTLSLSANETCNSPPSSTISPAHGMNFLKLIRISRWLGCLAGCPTPAFSVSVLRSSRALSSSAVVPLR